MNDPVKNVARALCARNVAYIVPAADQLSATDMQFDAGREMWIDWANAAITAYNAAIKEAGFVIVPREATLDMIAAGVITAKKKGGPWLTLMEGFDRCSETYTAMVDAADPDDAP